MQEVTIYTKPLCSFCVRAIALLNNKGAAIKNVSAAFSRAKREEMLSRSNGKTTYPQIFIGDTHVGGCDELMALERAGKLESLLNGQ
ncbi:MAG: glutaredoxin 3 [Alphaproteobacteria bacterium]|nr:glutaredoxin 3 [Alphaproteobacteria bacterium]